MMLPPGDLEDRFTFHPATDKTGPLHDDVRRKHLLMAVWVNEMVPDSREKSLALTALQEAMMWANAAVAIYGADPQ
jgi:hypothetical protein